MAASMNIGAAKGKDAGGAITKKRFVKLLATDQTGQTVVQCDTQGEKVFGVSLFSTSLAEAARGKGVSVITEGRAIVEAGGVVNVGDFVMAAADGRAIVATSTNYIVGMCDENGGVGAGSEIGVDFDFSGAKV